jgi:hypothetical protein
VRFAVGIWPWLDFPDPKPGERIPGLPEYDIQEKLAYHFPQKVFTLAQRSAMSLIVFGDILLPVVWYRNYEKGFTLRSMFWMTFGMARVFDLYHGHEGVWVTNALR